VLNISCNVCIYDNGKSRNFFKYACRYEVVYGCISAKNGSTIIKRERGETDMEKVQKHIGTQRHWGSLSGARGL